MMRTIQSQVGTVILSLEACRLYGEPTRICNSRERNGRPAVGSQPTGTPLPRRQLRYLQMAREISKRDKTSMIIDRQKLAEARELLGTETIAETVDAALDEVIRLGSRRRLWQHIQERGGIGPGPEELRRLRTP